MQHHAPVERNRPEHPQNHTGKYRCNRSETCCAWSRTSCVESWRLHTPANRPHWSVNRLRGNVKRCCCTCWSRCNSRTNASLKHPAVPRLLHPLCPPREIGRASCRERVEISVVAGALKQKIIN